MRLAPHAAAAHHRGMRILLLCCLAGAAVLAALDLDALPRPAAGGALVDAAGILDAAARARCAAAGAAAGGRLVAVVVPDCGGRQPREAGLRLFNRWGVGDPARDDGVLLLVALRERRAEFMLGDGIDDDANVLRSQAIVDRRMLPLFRAGDASGAVVAGCEAAARELFGGAPPARSEDIDVEGVAARPVAAPAPRPEAGPVPSPAPRAEPVSYRRDEGFSLPGSPLAWFAGLGTGGIIGGCGLVAWLRRRPRTCPRCQARMFRLDEAADDAHLSSGQRAEESVGSVDYDVWACPTCPQVQITRHGAWFSGHHACPACGWRTASDRSTEIEAATTMSTGRERIDTRCAHCGHHEVSYRTLPRKQQPSAGIRAGGGSFGGGFSSGGSGGGRSSGRGGGGGW